VSGHVAVSYSVLLIMKCNKCCVMLVLFALIACRSKTD